MSEQDKSRIPRLGLIVSGIALLALFGGGIWMVRGFLKDSPVKQKKVVQEVQIIRPPPPPPDQPPPPPPPPEEEQVHLDEPQPEPDAPSDEPPPGEQLGLDADGSAGGDAFGLLGRKGGRDLLASGGSALAWYGGLLKAEIVERLQDVKAARTGSYSVSVQVWVRADGNIERIQLAQSTGDRERDRAIEAALTRLDRLSQGPPANMPQPISIKVVARG
jgi:periplasmic protein TonB